MKNYWISWYANTEKIPFNLQSPWWVSGYRLVYDETSEDQPTIVAAIKASSKKAAMKKIIAAHKTPPKFIEWRFVEEKPDEWSPSCDRFHKEDWMVW